MGSVRIFAVLAALSGCVDANGPAAANFASVSASVVQSSRQFCLASAAEKSCDFVVVRLSDPSLPANAWQTIDEAGSPVLMITERLVQNTANADELAFVLAHEAAHHVAGHQNRALKEHGHKLAGLLGLAASPSEAGSGSPHVLEYEADALGARIMTAAGFDIRQAAGLFGRPALWDPEADTSSHPSMAERHARLLGT